MSATCLMANCRNKAPNDEAMCAKHRDDSGSVKRQRDRLLFALTPSATTKAAYMGEVETDVFGRQARTTVDWTAIKAIMALIRKQAGVE